MRVPHVRFTVRRMMVAVALLALLLWGGLVEIPRLRGLARDYRARAARHAATQKRFLKFFRDRDLCRVYWSALAVDRQAEAEAALCPEVPDGPADAVETWAELATQARDQAAWHARSIAQEGPKSEYFARMRWKYERAARYPWLPVAPDPPEPR